MLCVDFIVPYIIKRKGKEPLRLHTITMIDPVTGWFELHELPGDKKAHTVAQIVEKEWYARYPWPTQVIFDRGSEFMGHEFRDMIIHDYGSKAKSITPRNPQANAMLERIHQVVSNVLRGMQAQENPYLDEKNPWKDILSAIVFAIRATYQTTLKQTPAQMVCNRDMIFNITHKVNWELIKKRKQEVIDRNNSRENSKRIPHEYHSGYKVMIHLGTEYKQEQPYHGPYEIIQVHNNGTVTIKKGAVTERINIRQLQPFFEKNDLNHGAV